MIYMIYSILFWNPHLQLFLPLQNLGVTLSLALLQTELANPFRQGLRTELFRQQLWFHSRSARGRIHDPQTVDSRQ